MKKNTTSKKKPKDVKQESKKETPSLRESDSSSDYGGLPTRDLKKNLGCG